MAMFEKKSRVAKPKKAMWARDGRKKGPNVISFSVKTMADAIFTKDGCLEGSYLLEDGAIGFMQDFDECEYGKKYVGEALLDYWYPDGTSVEGGCYAYKNRQSLKDWCDLNEFPQPVRTLPFEFGDALSNGADVEEVFEILDRYLNEELDDDGATEALCELY